MITLCVEDRSKLNLHGCLWLDHDLAGGRYRKERSSVVYVDIRLQNVDDKRRINLGYIVILNQRVCNHSSLEVN